MHANALFSLVSALALTASAAPAAEIEPRAGACSSYTIINTRGTGEPQGESQGFTAINRRLTAEVPGGKVYNTVYLADASQNSALGTADIVNKIASTLRSNPDECFILQGYSQGAAATVNAMNRITGPNFDAVKGVFLIGNPNHKAGLACNVDINGGSTTRNVNGLSVFLGSIPNNWVSKTLDVCAFGDGVCDTTHGVGINAVHLTYPSSAASQKLGVDFAKKQLGA
ncbi:cutinase 1 [Apiospora rasikravindrae]|uniref:Cutinase 1 n=1 Tax=Apiospora rasikravindrae TaxID=990691 RepID=A0ABR1RPG0_9PEZI